MDCQELDATIRLDEQTSAQLFAQLLANGGLELADARSLSELADQFECAASLSATSGAGCQSPAHSFASLSSCQFGAGCCCSSSSSLSSCSDFSCLSSPASVSSSSSSCSLSYRPDKRVKNALAADRYRRRLRRKRVGLGEEMRQEELRNARLKQTIEFKLHLYKEFIELLAQNLPTKNDSLIGGSADDARLASIGLESICKVLPTAGVVSNKPQQQQHHLTSSEQHTDRFLVASLDQNLRASLEQTRARLTLLVSNSNDNINNYHHF